MELDLSWTKDYVLIEHQNNVTDIIFMITSPNHHAPLVTLSINDNINFLENLKQGFKRTISWNKYRSDITTQHKKITIWITRLIQNLGILIDCLFNGSRLVTMIRKEIILKSTTYR